MMKVSQQFIECLISAANFTNKHSPILKYVSIRNVGGAHEICSTDGFILALYTIKEDINWQINGYIDQEQIKYKKGHKFIKAELTKTGDSFGINVEYAAGKKREQVYLPIIETDVTYPNYSPIAKLDSVFNINRDSQYGEFIVSPESILRVLESLNTKKVRTIGLMPTEAPPFEISKADCITCTVYHDQTDNRSSSTKIGVLNIEATTRVREVPELQSPQLFNPSLLQLIFSEAAVMCGQYVTMYINKELKPTHIKGYSPKYFLESEYVIMPINRA
jgi:hypothetical protein